MVMLKSITIFYVGIFMEVCREGFWGMLGEVL